MARRHTTGWEVLGFGEDPTPGNPEAIKTLAGTYRELGDGAGEAVDLLRDDGAIRRGKGQAMDALKTRVGKDLPGLLEKTRDSFRTAASAYDEYATTLTDAQSMLDRAIDQGQEAAGTASAEVPTLAPDATPEQAEARRERQGEVDAAKEQLSAAVALGRDARNLREEGSRRASVILDEAAEQAIPARDFVKAFGDFLADNPLVEIIAGILVAIVAVFLPVVGLILGAVLFAVSVIRMVSQGKIDAGDIIIGLLTLVPGGVLLGGLGKVVAVAGKLVKFAPFLAKVGKGIGTTSAAVTAALKSSTFARKIIDPLGKGLVGLKTSPALALGAKFTIDAGTEFVLGFVASGLTAAFDGKKFDAASAAKGAALGAATAGTLTLFGGTKFANSIKDAFVTKGKFKSNIGKAFSLESLGVSGGQFKPGNILFVDAKGMGQKTGFHGINGTTKSDPSTGEVKTKVTTPDGTKTETKTTPPAPKSAEAPPADDLPFAPPAPDTTSTKTTTPDGFTSTTVDGTNTIESPAGDTITSNGTTTAVSTPIEGPTFKEKAAGVFGGEFAPALSAKPALSTELGPGGTFSTSGPFGGVSKDAAGTTTFSSPGEGAPTPEFTVNNNTVTTPAGLTVTENGGFTSVGGGGVHVDNQNGATSVFGNPAGGGQPVAVHHPADGSVDVNFGNTTINAPAGPFGGGVTLPDGTQVSVAADGAVNVANGDGGGQTVTLPPQGAGGPLTVTDGNVTTSIPPAGGATVTTPGGPVTTLGDTGFTVDTGGPRPDIVQFNGPGGTLDVTPAGGQPQVSVGPGGGLTTGGITTDGAGSGTATGSGGTIAFSPTDLTLGTPDGTSLTVTPQGRFDLNPPDGPPLTVGPNGDITVGAPGAAGVVFTTPDGGSISTKPGGGLDVTPAGGQPQVSVGPGGGLTTGGITTDGAGSGTATSSGGTIAFSPLEITFSTPDGTALSLNPNGKFSLDGISHGADGVTIAGSTTVDPDGSASIAHGDQEIHVTPDGTLTANDAQGNPVAPAVPGPTPGNAVNIGNTTISVDGTGGHTVTVHGNNGTTVTIAHGTTTIHSGPIQASHGPNGVTGTVGGPNPVQLHQGPGGTTTISQGGTSVTTSAGGPTTAGPQGQPAAVTVDGPTGTTPAQVTSADGSTTGVHADGTVTKSAPAGPGSQTVTVGGAGGGATVTVGAAGTTVTSGPLQAGQGPNGTTGSVGTLNPVHADQTPGGATTISHGGTSVTTSADGPTTTGQQGQPPSVTVVPATADGPTQVTTSGGSTSTLTADGAQTSVGTASTAGATVHQDGSVTTQAPAGPHTTVTHGPNGTTATDHGGTFGADHTGTATSGPVTVTAGTGAGNTPVATLTDTTAGGAQAAVGLHGIDSQGVTTTTGPGGEATFTHQPAGGGTTTVTSGPDGTITTQNPDGSGVQVPPRPAPAPGGIGPVGAPAPTTVTNGNGATLGTDGQTVTYESNGVTTTLGNDGNGPTTTTVHHESGVGHTVDGNGQLTVHNSPSDAAITATHTQVTVNTPQQEGWGLFNSPEMTGGQNTLSNGPNGPTIATHGVDPVSEPGSTVVHGPNQNGPEGEFSVTYGPATGTFAPGGTTGLGPSGTHLDPATGAPIDTAGNPLGNGPGQTSVTTVGGDGNSGITVPTPGGGPTLHHDGFFGGTTTVGTGATTLSKSPGSMENAGTAGQKSGVLDGPHNPLDPAPAPGPETFTVGGNGNGGPSLDVPVGGTGGSTVHGGPFDVKATGGGTFEVFVAGGGNGPNDKVTVGPDGTLGGPGVAAPAQPGGPQQVTLGDGTTVTGGPGTQPVVTPPGGAGPTTTLNNGTATTTDPAGGVTITQNPDGTATFTGNAAGETTTFTVTPDGVTGTVTLTGQGGQPTTFHVDLKNNGAVEVTGADGTTLTKLDAAGSYNEQHTPIHDYHANTGAPTSVTDLHEYGYEALTSILKGAVGQAVSVGYEVGANGADTQTALENAGIKLGYGVGNSLAGKKIENDYGFKTKGPEVPLASLPQKTLGGLNANQDTTLANPPEEAPIKV
ncbi:beta strand repeat-containing protein [Streptomyces hydrogenans]|uniref:beta strand repeat-containing protein n=1 Tax=Streptomyces hydrogenans TaxID=1873719 RepID=UPI00278C8BBC|nr:hypothetical protein [Streptomyces hydrogenans]